MLFRIVLIIDEVSASIRSTGFRPGCRIQKDTAKEEPEWEWEGQSTHRTESMQGLLDFVVGSVCVHVVGMGDGGIGIDGRDGIGDDRCQGADVNRNVSVVEEFLRKRNRVRDEDVLEDALGETVIGRVGKDGMRAERRAIAGDR